MRLKNPFLHLPKSIWRILKIDSKGQLWLKEQPIKPDLMELDHLQHWQLLTRPLADLAPAFVDLLWVATQNNPSLSDEALVKIMNSEGQVIIDLLLENDLRPLLERSGFKFSKALPNHRLVYQKDVIPCCGS